MDANPANYDDRYLAGILLFNAGDYFEAHEVWEDLWQECAGPERRFYQGLIQAAVGLLHFGNGNVRGAAKLYRTSRDYIQRYPSPFLGLDHEDFWRQMERCFAPLFATDNPDPAARPSPELLPQIRLAPEPQRWPDPADFCTPED